MEVLILGCERSGSTWLANIFDSHPRVELFMEPFAQYAGLFPGFPDRNVYLEAGNAELISFVKDGFRRLQEIKYPFFYRPGKPIYLKAVDRFLVHQYRYLGALMKYRVPSLIEQYELLNLHTSKIPLRRQVRKSTYGSVSVTKELRLNFKVGCLAKAFPEAVYVIPLRHPGAQISSIVQLFAKNHLGELRRSLLVFTDSLGKCHRFKKYWHAINTRNVGKLLESKLVLWWLINYDVLIEDLRVNKLNHHIVYHEDISENPGKVVADVFETCDLDMEQNVRDYLNTSSKSGTKHKSPIDTSRDSANYYKQTIAAVDRGLNNRVVEISRQLELEPVLQAYLKRHYPV